MSPLKSQTSAWRAARQVAALALQKAGDLTIDAKTVLAWLLGGGVWGRLADRSSRRVMMLGAGGASLVVLLFLGALRVPALREVALLYPLVYLLLALTHTGVRDRRTTYVAVSNTAMGLLLLAAGGASELVSLLGPEAVLVFLAGLGFAGVAVSRSLPEVSRG